MFQLETICDEIDLNSIKQLQSSSGWRVWIREITCIIKICGFGDLLHGNREKPMQHAEESDNDYKQRLNPWKIRQLQMLTIVRNRLGALVRDEFEEIETLSLTLEALEQKYKPRGTAAFLRLNHKYKHLTLGDCTSVRDYAGKLFEARDELEELDATCQISEPYFIMRFLEGLGSNYEFFSTVFCQNNRLLPERRGNEVVQRVVPFEEVIQAAEQEECNQKPIDASLSATRPRTVCGHCHKSGHQRERCWYLHPELASKPRERRRRKLVARQQQ